MKYENVLVLSILPCTIAANYHNDVVLKFHNASDEVARDFADRHNLIYQGRVLSDYYHFTNKRIRRRSILAHDYEAKFKDESNVVWFEQQKIKSRQKRDFVPKDPMYHDMWYLNPKYEEGGKLRTQPWAETRHMNITAAWNMGYTGKGVVVSILDDGIELKHPDLKMNYDKLASWDVNSNDDDPTPNYNYRNNKLDLTKKESFSNHQLNPPLTDFLVGYSKEINRHGTRCAGEVAATADNNVCVPGIAYKASVGGVRMLDGDVTDVVEAKSIGHNQDHVDIYSASWGPDDDGRTVDGPAKLAIEAFFQGATKGRQGKGNIFVWASGNGGRFQDNCNCDGYTNSIYTVSISSTSPSENIPWYSEECASTIASTYSSGTDHEKQILTTDVRGLCTAKHSGTSASAPIAAAIFALVLEANSFLSWRDIQHLTVLTSKKHDLHASDWKKNGVGRWFSGRYGYGLMDAGHLLELAKAWKNVPEQRLYVRNIVTDDKLYYKADNIGVKDATTTYTLTINEKDFGKGAINRMEHVTTVVTMNKVTGHRGKLQFFIQSPSGTKSMILGIRSHDSSSRGFDKYEFLTMELWDESPVGIWEFIAVSQDSVAVAPKVSALEVRIRGTGDDQYPQPTEETKTTTTLPKTHKVLVPVSSTTQTKPIKTTTKKITTTTTTTTTATTTTATTTTTTTKKVTKNKIEKPTIKTTTETTTRAEPIQTIERLSSFEPPNYFENFGKHTGLKQLIISLVLGCSLFYALCDWYVKRGGQKLSSKSHKTFKYVKLPANPNEF